MIESTYSDNAEETISAMEVPEESGKTSSTACDMCNRLFKSVKSLSSHKPWCSNRRGATESAAVVEASVLDYTEIAAVTTVPIATKTVLDDNDLVHARLMELFWPNARGRVESVCNTALSGGV
jgi:hypothetical protein